MFQHGGHITKDLYGSVPGVLRGGAAPIEWLLLDTFSTDLAAGAINATLSDSGHARTLTDSVPNAVITAGQFKVTAVAATRDPWLRYTTGWARVAGRMLRMGASSQNSSINYAPGFVTTLTNPTAANLLGTYFWASGGFRAGISNADIYPLTLGQIYTLTTILRSVGHFVVINGRLVYIVRTDSTTPVYPTVMALAADAAVDLRLDNIGIADLSLTDPTLFPTPTLSDTFSDTVAPLLSDGLAHIEAGGVNGAGVQWNGAGNFSNLANKGYIAPTPGADVVVNGAFAADTDWNKGAGWTIAAGVATKVAGVSTSLVQTVAPLTANLFYRTSVDFVINGGTFYIMYGTGILGSVRNTTGTFVETRRSSDSLFAIFAGGAPSDGTADNVSAKPLDFADCLRAVAPASANEPYASAKLTITASTQAGLVINLDSYTTPANAIHVWYDRVDSKVYARELIAGVWGSDKLAGIAATYSAGAYLEVRRIDDEVYVFYNGAYVGTWTTTLTNANSLVALFATDSASYAESMTSYPTDLLDLSAYVP